jgi:DNA polymerase III epsilon subunit-like protein
MPIWLALDFESTGLDFVKDRIIEVGAVLWSTGQRKCLESQGFLVKSDVPVSAEITKITGITQSAVDKFGYDSAGSLETVMDLIASADAVIGHNVTRFDRKMLYAWAAREGINDLPDMLWIDTFTDLPDTFATKLGYMAADSGFVNLFPHSALTDCLTVLKLVEKYDIEKVIERAKSPMVVVQAHQDRGQNELAKKAKFRWRPETKQWWKFVKEIDLEAFAKDLPFDVSVHRENIEEFQDL